VRTLGPVALATGLGQVLFTSAIGYGLALLLGFAPIAALYIAVALTFSSTIIIVKLLSDKRETDELHGRIAIGFLIVQDIVVVLVMIGLTAFAEPTAGGFGARPRVRGLRGAALLAVLALCMRYVLPRCCTASPTRPSSSCCSRSPGRSRWPPPGTSSASARRWGRSSPGSPSRPPTTARRSEDG
jgi:Kef-type K+ transport system membrane component KefB